MHTRFPSITKALTISIQKFSPQELMLNPTTLEFFARFNITRNMR